MRHPDQASDAKTIERSRAKQKVVRAAAGHWRNRWSVPQKYEAFAREQGALPLGDGTWLGYRKFATAKDAETHARKFITYNMANFGIGYLGTEFFPDY
ncbi:MAG: hypothetical protein ABL956_02730 [Hyphomonadaceae bacterium]